MRRPLVQHYPIDIECWSEEKMSGVDTEKPVFGSSGKKIVYDENGKPCRTCNSLLDFKFANSATKGKKPALVAAAAVAVKKDETPETYKECPPDVEVIGRSSWTLLHSIAATYPETPTNKQQADMKQFIKLFGNFYPCWFCADDFKEYLTKKEPQVETQDKFGRWLCDAHNDVNRKLGKPEFNCNLWKQRWKDGWEDGRCD